ncbi:MBL fold metallo-hydrolase [Paraliomyxa miuraensis]|uniref:MBL fold metallo-hydrolase n=1 Tax=Paraliomyxa miuraensis TaxID=376150 RepID=UPI0022535869|nr:hypothetical protein [Paraliomyxa miuraensis]MCX4246729.1 hypothetical protein [Paraliomyxa miuraensis]
MHGALEIRACLRVMKGWACIVGSGCVVACTGQGPSPAGTTRGETDSSTTSAASTATTLAADTTAASGEPGTSDGGSTSTGEPPPVPIPPLEVEFLGVGGVALRVGEVSTLTAPLYSNPSLLETTFGSIEPRIDVIDAYLPLDRVQDVAAILVGHGHYDHLMDVPYVWTKTADAMIYGNLSAARLLAGFDEVPPARVAVLNDPRAPLVDRRSCTEADPCTGVPAGIEGAWVPVPGAPIRLRALCSSHPPQFLGVIHFGEGCMEQEQTEPLATAAQWREGATLSYLVDFLDPRGVPLYRIYYQDAPADPPLGLPVPELLDEHRVDLAILTVGTFEAVMEHPEAAIAALDPRYVLAVHWENFFVTQDQPIEPIPFQPDPAEFDARALAALGDGSEAPLWVDGAAQDLRYLRPVPGVEFEVSHAGG